MTERILSQEEIDRVFKELRSRKPADVAERSAQVYDFRRPDRIAKDQLRCIHLLHENFARSLASSLSAYLRAYVLVNLISVEQLSFLEFAQCLPTPTCLATLGMQPYEGSALLEINPALVFPILEMLLGGTGKSTNRVTREVTEIEQCVLDGLYRIILNDLKEAWQSVANINFTVESQETEPQMLQMLAPSEALTAVSLEVRIGDASGIMNIGMPSIVIKMLRQRFGQQWTLRRTQPSDQDQARVLRLIQASELPLDVRLRGPSISLRDLLEIQAGDVLALDYPVSRPKVLEIGAKKKFFCQVVALGNKRAALLGEKVPEKRPPLESPAELAEA